MSKTKTPKKNKYWEDREVVAREKALDQSIETVTNKLKEYYKESSSKIIRQMEQLRLDVLENRPLDELNTTYLYQYDRYYKIVAQMEAELQSLGEKEIKLLTKEETSLYKRINDIIDVEYEMSTRVDTEAIKQAINGYWVGDGLNMKDRVWKNKRELATMLQDGLADAVGTGKSTDQLTRDIQQKFSTSWSKAERLVRTELAHVQIQATMDRYKKSGYNYYRFLCAFNESFDPQAYNKMHPKNKKGAVCTTCRAIEQANPTGYGKGIYSIAEAQTGVNLPVIHPNCRCSIVAVTDFKIKQIKEKQNVNNS